MNAAGLLVSGISLNAVSRGDEVKKAAAKDSGQAKSVKQKKWAGFLRPFFAPDSRLYSESRILAR
jgi:hypothetical protein